MTAQLRLDWLGGTAAARFRRCRPGTDDLPWGTLAATAMPAEVAARARASFTDGAFSEYASAAAFAALTGALLEAGAPVDLIAMSADFTVDEMVHVELNARLAMEVGGAAPYLVDLEQIAPLAPLDRPAIERAAELAIRISCIGETLSVPVLVGSAQAAEHPLVRAVLTRIVKDEPPHARIGWLVLDWALERLDRVWLARVALEALADYAPLWQPEGADEGCVVCNLAPEHRQILGRMDDEHYRRTLVDTVRQDIVRPLAARGVTIDLGTLLGDDGDRRRPTDRPREI